MKADAPQPDSGDAHPVAPSDRSAAQAAAGASSGTGVRASRPERDPRDTRDSLRDSLLVTHVDGMHSHRCEETIVRAVTALAGVREVEVDFASGQASIIFDARKLSSHQVIAAIEQAGYRCADPALGGEGGPVG